jgi:hypothetical protein
MAELVNQVAQFKYDNLFGGTDPVAITKNIILAAGAGKLARGTVLGKILVGSVSAVAKSGGNTGNGTITGLAIGAAAKIGVYKVRCTAAAAGGGTFSVTDPEGYRLGDTIAGVAYTGPISFTIAHGAADFVAGDGFDVTVPVGSGKFKTVNSANADGSQAADCVLEHAADATTTDVVATAYQSGMFNREALIFGGTDTADTHLETLRNLDIYLTSEKGV